MRLTIKSILARCNFNRAEAIAYAKQVAKEYPALRDEYSKIARIIFLEGLN